MTETLSADALIIGAGPAGSAAALVLSRSGHRVILVDRSRYPRDKTCGDALIPDALQALQQLGLKDDVLEGAKRLDSIRIYAPNQSHVSLHGEFACIERRALDDLLRRAAVEDGARFMAPYALAAPIEHEGVIRGAVLRQVGNGSEVRITAEFTMLATGASARPLEILGVCERQKASAIAARFYVRAPDTLAREFDHLCISYDRTICPGYGWIFPCPDNVFNVGVGYFYDSEVGPTEENIRHLMTRFLEEFPPAAKLVRQSRQVTRLEGAPLRTALEGSKLSRPGLLVIGEAAGLTYSFSGEGIGKAMQSGIIGATLVAEALRDGNGEVRNIADRYASRIRLEFAERFRAYKRAQDWLAWPRIADFLAWRARSGRYARRQMEGLLAETTDPSALFSVIGLLNALVR